MMNIVSYPAINSWPRPSSMRRKADAPSTVEFGKNISDGTIVRELKRLREQSLKLANETLAYDRNVYSSRKHLCPLTGHCGPVTYAVQRKLGGDIISAPITFTWQGKTYRETHYWNRIQGKEYDLTGSQYGGDGLHALDSPEQKITGRHENDIRVLEVGTRKLVPVRKSVNPRFIVLARKLGL